MTDSPEELESIWDDKIAEAFKALTPKQQDFLVVYLRTGNAAEAYRKAYNPLANTHVASGLGAQTVASKGISAILERFGDDKVHDLFLVVKTWREMAEASKPEWKQDKDGQWENVGDAPDWQARDNAAKGLAKLRGLNAADKVEHSGEIKSKIFRLNMPKKDPDVGAAPPGVPDATAR